MTLALDRRGHGHVPLTDAQGSSLCIHTAWGNLISETVRLCDTAFFQHCRLPHSH
jgi:hypothetical protein